MKRVWKWIIFIASAFLIVFLLRGFLFTPYVIPSSGMENSLYKGDRIVVNKWSYGLRVPFMSLFSYHRWFSQKVHLGDIAVFNDPASSEPVIDKRQVYLSRCLGLPGDTLVLDTLFTVISRWEKAGPDRKRLYTYPVDKEHQVDSLLRALALNDNRLMGENEREKVRSFSRYEIYLIEQALGENNWIVPVQNQDTTLVERKLVIPQAGQTINFEPWNRTLYINMVVLHENPEATITNDTLFVNNKPMESYTFTQNYHWMVSNNSLNMADSRLFGFVPETHLIGRAAFIWFSKEPDTDLLEGYRWNRVLKAAK